MHFLFIPNLLGIPVRTSLYLYMSNVSFIGDKYVELIGDYCDDSCDNQYLYWQDTDTFLCLSAKERKTVTEKTGFRPKLSKRVINLANLDKANKIKNEKKERRNNSLMNLKYNN